MNKCDIKGCKSVAAFSYKNIHLCKECKTELYLELAKNIVPKSPDAPYSPKRLVKF